MAKFSGGGGEQPTYEQLCSIENLELAYSKAKRGKTLKDYVIEFQTNLQQNLWGLRNELLLQTYKPRPLKTFILRDPKTRKISKSDFGDRIIHHAICNLIEPVFDKTFIHDSFANRPKQSLNTIKKQRLRNSVKRFCATKQAKTMRKIVQDKKAH